MKNLDEVVEKLKDIKRNIVSPKEIYELGITRYFMERLIKEGYLVKVGYGKYQAKSKENSYAYFYKFENAIVNKEYVKAYDFLIKNYKMRVNHDFDSHLYIYFTLLKEIIGDEYDFSMLDELYLFTFEKRENDFDYFIHFMENVMRGHFEEAERYLDLYKEREQKKRSSTRLFTILITEVNEKNLSRKKEEAQYNRELYLFNDLLYHGKYDEAMLSLERMLSYKVGSKVRQENLQYKKILEKIIEMDKDGIALKTGYLKFSKEDCFTALSKALEAEDYLTATAFTGACARENKDSYYRIIKMLIHHVDCLNRRNAKANATVNFLNVVEKWLQEGNDEETLSCLKECVKNPSYKRYQENIKNCISMIEKIIRMKHKRELLNEDTFNYSMCSNHLSYFLQALHYADYKSALKWIGPITFESKSKTFDVMKKLLYMMKELDARNRKLERLEKEKARLLEAKKQEEAPKPIEIEVEPKLKSLEVIEKEGVKQESIVTVYLSETIEKEKEEQEEAFDEAILYDLIYNCEYEKARQLLEKESQKPDRMKKVFTVTLALLRQWKKMNEKILIFDSCHEYEYQDGFPMFFEALRVKDYEVAYSLVIQLQEFAQDKREFEMYRIILEDMMPFVKGAKRINELTECIQHAFSELNEENLEGLYNLIEEKIEILKSLGYMYSKDELLSHIIENILLCQRDRLTSACFETLKNEDVSISKQFENCIYNGDYVTSKRILEETNWEELTSEGKFTFATLKNIKKLFFLLDYILFKNEVKKNVECVSDIPPIDAPLKELTSLVKHRKYHEALKQILDRKCQVEDGSIITSLIEAEFICQFLSRVYEESFSKFVSDGDAFEALKTLNAYESYLEAYHLSKDLSQERMIVKNLKN